MHTVRTMNVDLTRDLKLAGMTDQEVCAWSYFAAVRQECEQICIIHPGGWERTYSMTEVRAMLVKNPSLMGEISMGTNRFRRLQQLEGGKPLSLL